MYEIIKDLLQGTEFSIVESFQTSGRGARYAEIPSFLFDSPVGAYLAQWSREVNGGEPGLWSHQVEALSGLGRGENVVISTGTASGKSLVFQALAMHKVLLDPSARVVVFYPLLALVADQLRGWRRMAHAVNLDESVIGQIDGTVDVRARDDILARSRVIVMTPDVCHAWLMSRLATPVVKNFVGALSTIVMDEAHTLEGVFGSNFAFLMRRLTAARNQLVGTGPETAPLQLVAATATISNPEEHMRKLTGADFRVVDHDADGAPHHDRLIAHIACPEGEEIQLATTLQERVLSSGTDGGFITFMDSRKGVETLAMASQPNIEELAKDPTVVPYRAGFTSQDRQKIEGQLRRGQLRGVISTSALELGIDLPHLRVGFNLGVPATRKSYRQRLGRVGRNGPGAFVVIASPNAFRRYGTTFREYHDMSVEPSYLYLDNRFVQFAHGRCLADERDALAAPVALPARVQWPGGFREIYDAARPGGSRPPEFDAVAQLGGDTPQRGYPLRNVGELNYQIKIHEDADNIGNVNQSQALRECYPGATYLHNSRAYEVLAWRSNAFNPFIRVKNTSPMRYTRPRISTWINTGLTATDVIEGHILEGESGFLAECQMLITERVEGYIDAQGRFHSYQELRQHNPNMIARQRNFRTSGVVLCIDQEWFKSVKSTFVDRLVEVFVHEHSVQSYDIGSAATNISIRGLDGQRLHGGCVAVFDQTYGSLRLTEKLYLEFSLILERLSAAADSETDQDLNILGPVIELLKAEFANFTRGVLDSRSAQDSPTGYEQVFTEGSRVCYREKGAIATDVEIIQPTMMDGVLMYQVKVPVRIGQASMRRWLMASAVEPSGESDAWEYGWWNRETEIYEDPPDDLLLQG